MFKTSYRKIITLAVALITLLAITISQGQTGFKYWTLCDTCVNAPKLLSATGLYTDIVSVKKKLLPTAYYYEVNSPLWSDDAKKMRWVLLKPGTTIEYSDASDYYGYPDGTVFIKQFAIDTITGVASSRVLWETRLLINQKEVLDSAQNTMTDHWYGFSYKWNKDQKDAQLVEADYYSGMRDSIRIWPNGTAKTSRQKKWVFPSAYLCAKCHRTEMGFSTPSLHARSVLGFFTAQLNRPAPDSAGVNQLEYLFGKGVLTGRKPTFWNASSVPRWYPIDDATAPLDTRARAYLAANCSGCHGKRGNGVGAAQMCDINFDFHTMTPQMELRHRYASSRGLDTLLPKYYSKNDYGNNPEHLDTILIQPGIVVPGFPQKSLVVFRQTERNEMPGEYGGNPNQMPPNSTYSTFEVNTMAMDSISKWIKTMSGIPCPECVTGAFNHRRQIQSVAQLQGRRLLLSKAEAGSKVSMSSVNGRKVLLQKSGVGEYTVPGDVPKGLYLIQIGSRSMLRYYFREE